MCNVYNNTRSLLPEANVDIAFNLLIQSKSNVRVRSNEIIKLREVIAQRANRKLLDNMISVTDGYYNGSRKMEWRSVHTQ